MPAWTLKKLVRTPLLLMGIVETIILFSSVYAAAWFTFGSLEEFEKVAGQIMPRAAVIVFVNLICLIAMGLYHFHQRIFFREAVGRVIVGLSIGSAFVALIFYASPWFTVATGTTFLAIAYALALLLIVRYFFVRTVDENVFRYKTLIYGAGTRARSIDDLRRRADRRGFEIVGRVIAPGDVAVNGGQWIRPNGRTITELAIETGADEIVVAMDERRGNLPIRELLTAKLQGIDVIDLLEFLERETGKIRIDLVNPGWLIFSPGFRSSQLGRFNKRALDISMTLLIMSLAWPVMLLVTLAIKIEDGFRAPVFYRQTRVGQGSKTVSVIKFRSMQIDAESDGKAVWASMNDSRVTRVGNFLRNSRLDELPQLFNVLRGEMSLVGPRPERPEFVKELQESIPYYAERHFVRPGITGWAQLRLHYGASEQDAVQKLQYELYYVKNQSLMLDFMIILQTVEVILWSRGAR